MSNDCARLADLWIVLQGQKFPSGKHATGLFFFTWKRETQLMIQWLQRLAVLRKDMNSGCVWRMKVFFFDKRRNKKWGRSEVIRCSITFLSCFLSTFSLYSPYFLSLSISFFLKMVNIDKEEDDHRLAIHSCDCFAYLLTLSFSNLFDIELFSGEKEFLVKQNEQEQEARDDEVDYKHLHHSLDVREMR